MAVTKQPEPEYVKDWALTETEAWRKDQLVRAGFPFLDALDIAISPSDLHVACDMLEHGCPLELALKILS